MTPRTELASAAGCTRRQRDRRRPPPRVHRPGHLRSRRRRQRGHPHYRRHLRVEHWANALHQGTTAGRNAVGALDVYDRLPYFFSDQYDLGLEYVGRASPDDDVIVRGDLDQREFIAFWHRNGVVTAAMNVNIWDVAEDLKSIVAAGTPADLDRLADPDVALTRVLAAA